MAEVGGVTDRIEKKFTNQKPKPGLPEGVMVHSCDVDTPGGKPVMPNDFHQNKKIVAGYLGFPTTEGLRDFVNEEFNKDLTDELFQEKGRNEKINPIQVFNFLTPAYITLYLDEFAADELPPHSELATRIYGVDAKDAFKARYALAIFQLIRHNSDVFIDSTLESETPRLDPEDAMRALVLFRCFKLAADKKFDSTKPYKLVNATSLSPCYYNPNHTAAEDGGAHASNLPGVAVDDIDHDERRQTAEEVIILGQVVNHGKPSQTVPKRELAGVLDEFFSYRGGDEFGPPGVSGCPTWLRDPKLTSDREAAKAFNFSNSNGEDELTTRRIDSQWEAAQQALLQEEEDHRAARDGNLRGGPSGETEPSSPLDSHDEVEFQFNDQSVPMPLPTDLPDILDTAAAMGLGEDFEVPLIANRKTPLPSGFVPLKLHPWQVEAVGWLLQKQFETNLKGAILAHDVGLGKTVSALMFLKQSTERSLRNLQPGQYRPNVLIVPANLIAQWTDEACLKTEAHTGLRLRVFQYDRVAIPKGTRIEKHHLTKEEFYGDLVLEQRGIFDPWNPATQQTVILTSYTTWHPRTVCTVRRAIELANAGYINEDQFAEGLPEPDINAEVEDEVDAAEETEASDDEEIEASKDEETEASEDEDIEASESEDTEANESEENEAGSHPTGTTENIPAPRTLAQKMYVKFAVRRFVEACRKSGSFRRGKDSRTFCQKMANSTATGLEDGFVKKELEMKREYMEHKRKSANWRSLVEGRVSLVVIDEASAAKSMWTLTWISIKNMRADFVAMLSATPCPNNDIDWIAFLALIHPAPDSAEDFDWYKAVNHPDILSKYPEIEKQHGREAILRIYQLPEFVAQRTNPDIFSLLCDEGRLDPCWSSRVFPQLLPLFVLPCKHGQMMVVHPGRPAIEVGAGIPPYVLRQCRLLPPRSEASQYYLLHENIKNDIYKGQIEMQGGGTQGKVNLGAYRQLQIASASPYLSIASQIINKDLPLDHDGPKFDSAYYVNMLAQTSDLGISFLLDRMTIDPCMPPGFAQTGYQRASFLAHRSVKLRYLAGILKFHVHLRGEKIIIVAEWPLIMLMILAFTASLGFKTLMLTSNMKEHERHAVQEKWNNPSDEHQILLSTGRVISFGYNLHHCCNTMVVFDCPSSYLLLFQRLGRVHRLGQIKTQYIYHLFAMGTVDEYRHFRCSEKLRALSVSRGRDDIAAQLASNGIDMNSLTDQAQMEHIYKYAMDAIVHMTGAPSTCLLDGWSDVKNCGLNRRGKRDPARDEPEVRSGQGASELQRHRRKRTKLGTKAEQQSSIRTDD